MKPILRIQIPGGFSQEIEITSDTQDLGRHSDNDIVIQSGAVSRKHARIEKRSDSWWYIDLGSKNGTFLNDKRVEEIKLTDGMVLTLGDRPEKSVSLTITFSSAEVKPTSSLHHRSVTEQEGASPVSGYTNLPSILLTSPGKQILGRDENADIRLPAPVVSRQHASIQKGSSGWSLTDLGSKNGTFLNGRRITNSVNLHAGNIIQIGPFQLIYEGDGKLSRYSASEGLRLDGIKISWIAGKGHRRKTILNDVNISCYPREFIALVGGSGAGKSTLIKVLSGLLPPDGQVLVEGENLYKNFDAYRTMIGYVPQDDILHQDLKVQEALEYSARLRLPPDTSESEIKARVKQAMEQVELTAQKDQVISSLSGGQRKRASIAAELLADPPLFFLDEPTSGLDPGLEKKIMVILRKLADNGKTIILVTHATANITECHRVAFMSQGRLVYYGPPQQACEYFDVENEDFAEIYNRISDPDPGQAKHNAAFWEKRHRESRYFNEIMERFKSLPDVKYRPNGMKEVQGISILSSINQFLLLTKRYFSLILRDRTLLIILMAVMPLLGLLILGIAESNWLTGDTLAEVSRKLASQMENGEKTASYFIVGDAQKLLFIMALTAVMLGLFSSAYEIVKERTVYMRERMVFMQLLPYLASKIVPLAVFAAVQCLLFLLVIRSKVVFPSSGVILPAALEMYITLFLSVLTALCLGLFISAIAPNQNTVTYIILGMLFLQITFAGVIFEIPNTAKSVSSTTLTRWTMQALGTTSNLDHLENLSRTRFQPDPVSQPGTGQIMAADPVEIETPYGVTLNYEHSLINLFQNWFMLLFLAMSFSIGTLIALKRQDIIR